MTFFNFIPRELIYGKLDVDHHYAPEKQNCYGEIVSNPNRREKRDIEGDLDDHTAERAARLWKRYRR